MRFLNNINKSKSIRSIFLICLLFPTFISLAQWEVKNPKYFWPIQTYSLVSKNHSWFSVKGGILFHLDAENEVLEEIYRHDSDFQNLSFVDSLVGYAVSESLLKTIDGGKTWQSIGEILNEWGGQEKVYGLKFITRDIGFYQDRWQTLYRTTNGGVTWYRNIPGVTLGSYNENLSVVSKNYLKYSTFSMIGSSQDIKKYKSINLGESWSDITYLNEDPRETLLSKVQFGDTIDWIIEPEQDFPKSVTPALLNILTNSLPFYFSSLSIVDTLINYGFQYSWNTKNYNLINTKNGGISWDTVKEVSKDVSNNNLYEKNFEMFDKNIGIWIDASKIITTNDGWKTDQYLFRVDPNLADDILDIHDSGKLQSHAVTKSGTWLISNNNGNNWEIGTINNLPKLSKAIILNPLTCYAINDKIFYSTTNQGLTWQEYNFTENLIGSARLLDIHFLDENIGWISAENNTLFRTEDGGKSWEAIFVDSPSDWNNSFNQHIQNIFFFDSNNGYLLFGERFILKSNDGGKSFTDPINLDWTTKEILFETPNKWWVRTLGFGIALTINAGETWTTFPNYPDDGFQTYNIFSYNKIMFAFYGRNLAYTIDDGLTWIKEEFEFNKDIILQLNGMFCTAEGEVWVWGNNGLILANDLIVPSDTPDNYRLSQNYPNPFNSETVIEFSISKGGYTSLKIYNILGEEIAALVDGYLDIGSFKHIVKGKNLSSGVYFYRLVTDNYVETRKMIILK